MTLRLLLALKLKLAWRALTVDGRWLAVLGPVAMLAVLSPLVAAGAWFAWHAEQIVGPQAFVLVFGASLVVWLSFAIALSTLGSALDPARVLRYPIAPVQLFVFEMLAALLEPVAIAALVPPVALAIATLAHHGFGAGALAALGVTLFALTGAALLQLLVAALDRLLRLEWSRVLAALALAGAFLLTQWASRHLGAQFLRPLLAGDAAESALLADLVRALARLAPAAWPAHVAAAALGGSAWRALGGGVASLALIATAALLGARLLARNALREVSAVRASVRQRGASPDPFALIGFGLPAEAALVARASARQWVRSPRGLFTLLIVPTALAIYYLALPTEGIDPTYMGLTMALASVAQGSTLLYSHLGPGVRTLALLPLSSRAIVLGQNAVYLAQLGLLLLVLAALYARSGHGVFTAQRLPWLLVGIACALVLMGAGNLWAIRFPVRMPRRFGNARNADWRPGLAQLAVLALTAGACALLVVGPRRLVPAPMRDALSLAMAALSALIAAAIAWSCVARASRLWDQRRERLIEVLAKDEP